MQPRTLTLGPVRVGATSTPQTVTVTNTGSTDLPTAWVGLAGTDATQFARVRNCAAVLTAGQQCTATVTFTPDTAGTHEARLVVCSGTTRKSTAVSGAGQ